MSRCLSLASFLTGRAIVELFSTKFLSLNFHLYYNSTNLPRPFAKWQFHALIPETKDSSNFFCRNKRLQRKIYLHIGGFGEFKSSHISKDESQLSVNHDHYQYYAYAHVYRECTEIDALNNNER